MKKPIHAALSTLVCVLAGVMQPASAQSDKILTIIVPTTPGTGSDIAARQLAPRLSKELGRNIVVENKTGASGTIGIREVARAPADGNTVLFVPNTMAMISSLYTKLDWDPVKDFTPVAQIGKMLVGLVVNPNVPARTINELIALTQKNPGKFNYASPGVGTPHHLRAEQFKQISGADLVHVPYSGSAGAVTDLVGGQVQAGFFPLHSILPMSTTDRLRILATSGDASSPWTPDTPTFTQSGVKGLNNYDWVGVFYPKGTPQTEVDRLSKALLRLLAMPEVQEELAGRGIIANPGTPEQMTELLAKELKEWKQVVVNANISAD